MRSWDQALLGLAAIGVIGCPHASDPGPVSALPPKAPADLWNETCRACHGSGIGPDLFDDAWLHGGSYEEILATISAGVLEKGCPTWLGIYSQAELEALTAWLLASEDPPP